MTKLVHKNSYTLYTGERVIMLKIANNTLTPDYQFQAVLASDQDVKAGIYTDDGFYWNTKEVNTRNVNFEEEVMKEVTAMNLSRVVTELVDGTSFYTERGTKVFFKDNKFYFGSATLNITKLLGCKLSKNVEKEVNKVCRVWDHKDSTSVYQLVVKVNKTCIYPYITNTGEVWKYAEVVIQ